MFWVREIVDLDALHATPEPDIAPMSDDRRDRARGEEPEIVTLTALPIRSVLATAPTSFADRIAKGVAAKIASYHGGPADAAAIDVLGFLARPPPFTKPFTFANGLTINVSSGYHDMLTNDPDVLAHAESLYGVAPAS